MQVTACGGHLLQKGEAPAKPAFDTETKYSTRTRFWLLQELAEDHSVTASERLSSGRRPGQREVADQGLAFDKATVTLGGGAVQKCHYRVSCARMQPTTSCNTALPCVSPRFSRSQLIVTA